MARLRSRAHRPKAFAKKSRSTTKLADLGVELLDVGLPVASAASALPENTDPSRPLPACAKSRSRLMHPVPGRQLASVSSPSALQGPPRLEIRRITLPSCSPSISSSRQSDTSLISLSEIRGATSQLPAAGQEQHRARKCGPTRLIDQRRTRPWLGGKENGYVVRHPPPEAEGGGR